MQTGTLRELGVKPGDVVKCLENENVKNSYTVGKNYTVYGKDDSNTPVDADEDYCVFRLISRASDKPKTWGEMSDAEKGALLLAEHDGSQVQIYLRDEWRDVTTGRSDNFCDEQAYRVRRESTRETVALTGTVRKFSHMAGMHDTHRITFDTIDGEPDCASVKMERIK